MAPALSGCLDPTPEYTVPDRVPPVLEVDKIDPQTTAVIRVTRTSSETVPFTVPFRADDAGDGLVAFFIHDIPVGRVSFTNVDGIVHLAADPRPFAEQAAPHRPSVEFNWKWSTVGCHTMTMILSHTQDVETINGFIDLKDPLAAARVTWFFALSDSSGTQDCGSWPIPSAGLAR